MKKYLLVLFIWLFLASPALYFLYNYTQNQPKSAEAVCTYSDEEILRLINLEREKVGVHPLVEDSFLSEVSLKRAEQQNGIIDSHVGFHQMDKEGVFNIDKYVYVGENIAGDESNIGICPDVCVYSWMISTEGHREAMLNPRYDEIGIGYHKGIVVTIFGDIKSD